MASDLSFEELLGSSCSKMALSIAIDEVCRHPHRVHELVGIAKSTAPYAWRAAWALAHLNEQAPGMLVGLSHDVQQLFLSTSSYSIKRELLKVLRSQPLPDGDVGGELLDVCFTLSQSGVAPVGLRMYALDMVYRFCVVYPELKPELVAVLEDIVAEPPSVGIKGWAKRLLQQLAKLNG